MKPPRFAYRDPADLREALDVLQDAQDEAVVLAGGQSLMPLLNLRLAQPEIVLDINRVEGLDTIEVTDSTVRIGALVRARALEQHAEVHDRLPVLGEAVRHVGHPQIRNRTSIGGNIAHADPSSELPSVLAAVGGSIELTSVAGVRHVPWDDFFIAAFVTAREPDELVTAVRFPLEARFDFRFSEVARRHGDFPVAGLCTGTRVTEGRLVDVRLAAIGAVHRPSRLYAVEDVLRGSDANDPAARRQAREALYDTVVPPEDIHASADYRRSLLVTLMNRTLDEIGMRGA